MDRHRRSGSRRQKTVAPLMHRCLPRIEFLENRQLLASFPVTSTADDGSMYTLRWAVDQADGAATPSTITFDLTQTQTITLQEGPLALTNTQDSVDFVVSTGSLTPIIDGNGAGQIFQVNPNVTATMSGVTITGGSTISNGGGIYNQGDLTLTDCTITANTAGSQGGGIDNTQGATLTIQGGTISNNTASTSGGGVLEEGTLSANGTMFVDNTAGGWGGAFNASNGGNYDLDTCQFTGNDAGGGGAISNSGGASGTIWASTFSGNSGGAISVLGGSLTINNSSISSNIANQGGGLYVSQGSTLNMESCTISGNSAQNGGGLWNGGTATLTGCTVSANYAAGNGGGIAGAANLTDCTIAGNSAYGDGGGILGSNSGTGGTLIACTVSGNTAGSGGGIYSYSSYPIALTDTIVANNTNGNAYASDIGGGGGATGSYNLIGIGGSGGIADGSDGNIVLTSIADLNLGSLENNGGRTETMALLPGSPAIQAGTAVSGVTTDQRGLPLDSPPDIGAFQVQSGSSGSPYTVTVTADSGPGSLRQAIEDADANGGSVTITFAIGTGQQTIDLLSLLPAITAPVTIDGTTQPGYTGTPLIDLDGASAGSSTDGLTINANDVTITGLIVSGFGGFGLVLNANDGLIQGSYIGTDPSGSFAVGNANGGVEILGSGNTVGGTVAGAGNVISGNSGDGIVISGAGTSQNVIAGDLVGTDYSGSFSVGNEYQGIDIDSGAADNTIGGTVAGSGNVVSGNGACGLFIVGAGTSDNLIVGNLVGTDVNGSYAIGNAFQGIYFGPGTSTNTVGGTIGEDGNLISANGNGGIWLNGASDDLVMGNRIGTDATGTLALGNTYSGVYIDAGASKNTVGGTITGSGNLISGNYNYGVVISGQGTSQNVMAEDEIGTDVTGTTPVPNVDGGILVSDGGSLTLGSNSLISGGVTVTQNGAIDITGSDNTISGDVSLKAGGTVDISGSGNAISGSVHLGHGGLSGSGSQSGSSSGSGGISVSGPSNTISGGVFVAVGALTVSGGDGGLAITGPLTFPGISSLEQLSVQGGAAFTASGAVTLSGGSVSASSGGMLGLPGLTSITNAYNLTFNADGAGSEIDLSNLTSFAGYLNNDISVTNGAAVVLSTSLRSLDGVTITVDGTGSIPLDQLTVLADGGLTFDGGSYTLPELSDVDGSNFEAQGGGSLELPAVTGVSYGTAAGFPATSFEAGAYVYPGNYISAGVITLPNLSSIDVPFYGVDISALGSGSQVDLPALMTFDEGSLSETEGATILDDNLTNLSGVAVTLDGTGTIQTSQWESVTNGSLTINGGDYSSTTSPPFASLANIDGSNISVGQGSLALPAVTSIAINANDYGPTTFQVGNDGILSLAALTTISSGNPVTITASGQGSEIDVPDLTSIALNTNDGFLSVTDNATLVDPSLTSLNGLRVTFDGTGIVQTSQWQTMTNGSLTIEGGNYSSTTSPPFASLADINGSGVSVEDGGSLTLAAVISYANPNSYAFGYSPLLASGADSTLSLPNLVRVDVSGFDTDVPIEALQGGHVLVPSLDEINITSEYSGEFGVSFESDGSGSLVDISALTNFLGGAAGASLAFTNGGTVIDAELTSFNNITISTDPTGTFTLPSYQTYSFTGGTNTIQTGTLDIEGSLSVQNNATLNVEGSIAVNGQGALSSSSGSTIELSGNLLGYTQNPGAFVPQGNVVFDGGRGTSKPPQLLEAMSADLGGTQTGFIDNFAYGTFSLTANTDVELVDQAINSPGTAPEAVYANELVLAAGATLNLNNLNFYVRESQIASTANIINGTGTQAPSGGTIVEGTPTAGNLAAAGDVDDWTFSGQAGGTVAIDVNPGSGGSPPALYPQLGWVSVELLDPNGNVLASVTNTSSGFGSIVQLTGVALTVTGTYTIQIQAPSSYLSSTGNYVTTIVALPDLVVSNISNPATGATDQPVQISWTDSNQGSGDVTNGWEDQVFASPDGTLTHATLLGDFPEPGTLAAGTSVDIVHYVDLPGIAGTYSIIVVTNANGAVNEGPNAGNDVTVSSTSIDVVQEPLPDLTVTSITPPPNGVFSGQSVPITYTVENIGTGSTSTPVWQDAVILSQDPDLTYNGGLGPFDDLTLWNQPVVDFFHNPSYLGAGQSYQQTVDVTLPLTAAGPWFVYVVANGLGYHHHPSLAESNRTNNLVVSAAFNVQFTPPPALDVSSVVAPSQAFSGQPLTIDWTVANVGTGPTAATSWTDEVFMSPTSTFNASTATPLGEFTHAGALAAGDSYRQSQSVTLPVGVSGAYYFIVQTDVNGQVFQDGDTVGNIGAEATTTNVNLTPPPDLTVTSVTASPTPVLAGHTLDVTYTVANDGSSPTGMASGAKVPVDWTDSFYLSPTPSLNPSTELSIGTWTNTDTIDAGSSYTNQVALTLPNGLTGTYYVIVDADSGNAIFELDLSSKVAATTSTVSVSSQPADLVVTAFNAPAQLLAGAGVDMSWTVANQGTGDTVVTTWNDEVFASASPDLSSPILLGTFAHNGLLNAGQSYTTSQTVTIPISLSGAYYLFVITNPATTNPTTLQNTYAVYESNYANDTSATVTTTVTQALADLDVTAVNAPSTLETGETVTIIWTTDNDGVATTNANSWYDDVWISTTSDVGLALPGVYLGSYYRSNALAADQSYTGTATVTIPQTLTPGTYYIIVRADRPTQVPTSTDPTTVNRVYESNESNNSTATGAISLTAGPAPDLAVTALSAPTMAVENQPITVSWTVTNNDASTSQSWNDAVYLSLNTIFDPTSNIYLGYAAHTGGLASGQSYTQQESFNVPAGLTGNFYVLVVTNEGDTIYETNYANDVGDSAQQVDITLTPPVDLVAGTITIPPNAVTGEAMTFSYTVTNQGMGDAVGQWADSLYLSPTTSFVYTDPLLATNVHTGGLAAGQSYTDEVTAPVPGVSPGTYYVILRTDVLDQIPETNLANNVAASLSNVSIGVPSLILGTPASLTLTQAQSAYYGVTVTAGQTLQFALTAGSGDTGASNELYVSFGDVPSRSQFDFTGGQPLSPDQTITVAATQSGTYYILAYADSLPGTNENLTLTASIIPFAVTAVTPSQVGNAGPSTLEIQGAQFDRDTTFQLVGPSGEVVASTAVDIQDAATAYVTFNLTGVPVGAYSVVATSSTGTQAQLATALNVDQGTGGELQTNVMVPAHELPNSIASFTVYYKNTGDADIAAPLLTVTSPTYTLMGLDEDDIVDESILFLGSVSSGGPAGILRPGEMESQTFYFQSPSTIGAAYDFQLEVRTSGDTTPMDWSLVQSWAGSSVTTSSDWPAIFAELQQQVGPTWGDYVQMLAQTANLVSPATGDPSDPFVLLHMEIQKATAAVDGSISGALQSPDLSIPIDGVAVFAQNTVTQAQYSSLTNNDGSFVFPTLPDGSYTISVAGWYATSGGSITVTDGQPITDDDVILEPGGNIGGHVLNQSTNEPIIGLPVTLTEPDGTSLSTRTDSDGNYDFSSLAEGTYTVYWTLGGPQTSQTVTVTQADMDGENVTANLQLAYSAILGGNLVDASGNPITDGSVTLYLSGNPIATAQTDATGAYEFLVVSPGTFELVAAAPEGTFSPAQDIQVVAGSSVVQDFEAGTGSLLVTAADDAQTVLGDTVDLLAVLEGTQTTLSQTTVGSDGTASLTDLAPGQYTIIVGSPTGDIGQGTITIAAGESAQLAISLTPQAGVSGTVTDSAGNPIDDAHVILQSSSDLQEIYSTTTAVDGTYSLPGIPAGTYDVTVFAQGYLAVTQAAITAAVSQPTTVNATLPVSTTTISGSLVDPSGNAVPQGEVAVYDQAGHLIGLGNVEADGTFEITSAQGNNLTAQVVAVGYNNVAPYALAAQPGATVNLSPITLQPVAIDPGNGQAGGTGGTISIATPLGTITAQISLPGGNNNLTFIGNGGNAYSINGQLYLEHSVFTPEGLGLKLIQCGYQFHWIQVVNSTSTIDGGSPFYSNEINLGSNLLIVDQPRVPGLGPDRNNANNVLFSSFNSSFDTFLVVTGGPSNGPIPANQFVVVAGYSWSVGAQANYTNILQQIADIGTSFKVVYASAPTNIGRQAAIITAAMTNSGISGWTANLEDPGSLHCNCDGGGGGGGGSGGGGGGDVSPPHDPNSIMGPSGFGDEGFVTLDEPLAYTIDFENEPTAGLPAQQVVITEQLDSNLDWRSFRLGDFGFGGTTYTVAPNSAFMQQTIDLTQQDGFVVQVTADVNVQTGLVTWIFTTIDPATGQIPVDPSLGFLPPDNVSGAGEGFVSYTILPKSSDPTGTVINAQATVVFDTQPPLNTPQIFNTIDVGTGLTSTVAALPPDEESPDFAVAWSGTDSSSGSAIASFTIFVSDNGGPFTAWLTNTTLTSASYLGQYGHTYSFYSVATDNAGNVEPTPSSAQATTSVVSPVSVSSITAVSPNPRNSYVSSVDVTFSEPINTSSLATGALTLTDDGNGVTIGSSVTLTLVSGDTYAIGDLSTLTAAQGEYTLTVNSADIQDQNGVAGTNALSTSWLMDTTAPSSHVVNSLGTSQTSDTIPVSVTFSDPTSPGGASGVSAVQLWVSINNSAFSLSQTMNITPAGSGTVTFSFAGQDRNVYAFHSIAIDAAGNAESKNSNTIEASTSVPDLNPPVTHVLTDSPTYSWGPFPSSEFSGFNASSYSNGVFTLNWAGADPDQNSGTPAGSIAAADIYVEIDTSTTPTLIGQLSGGTPNGSGVYSGSMTYDALADNQLHTYKFFSVGIDDEQKAQAMPGSPDVTFSETYGASLAVTNLAVEKGIAERSFIEYLDVDFNQTASSNTSLQALANELGSTTATNKTSYLELLWYGEGTPSASSPKGSVNLFGTGTTATVMLTGSDLSISFGANGITSLLTETGVTGTGKPTTNFGDGWYALGIDTTGGNGPIFWEPFFRLFGSATGDATVTGPYTQSGTDAYAVYHAEGESGALLNADVDGSGAVNSKDLTDTVAANGHAVGAGFLQGTSYPAFQLFAGSSVAVPANATLVTQSEVQSLLPAAISAWQAAGLYAADVRELESVPIQVSNLGTTILGLEAGGVITINQTAAGFNWYVSAGSTSNQAFALAGPDGESLAGPASPARNEVDLVTVLEHELGHVLGLPDNADAGDLMDITLGLGVSRGPSSADLAEVVSSSNTVGVVNVGAPLPAIAAPLSQPNPSSVLATPATVDAALASMLSAGAGNGHDHDPTANIGSTASSIGRHSSVKVANRRKGHTSQASLRYPDGPLSSRFASRFVNASIRKDRPL